MTNENPYKVGDRIQVVSTTAYARDFTECVGTVCSVFSPLLATYCVWVKLDSDELGYEWPFALEEVAPHSPFIGEC